MSYGQTKPYFVLSLFFAFNLFIQDFNIPTHLVQLKRSYKVLYLFLTISQLSDNNNRISFVALEAFPSTLSCIDPIDAKALYTMYP